MSFLIQTDGGARGNPGPAAIGVRLSKNGEEITKYGKRIGETTNNVAEYQALVSAWQTLVDTIPLAERGEVLVKMDSELIIKQMRGEYRIKNLELTRYAIKIKSLEREWGSKASYQHVPRSENQICDSLVNSALDSPDETP